MKFIPTAISEVIRIKPKTFADARGFFLETFQAKIYKEAGIASNFVQDNHSGSKRGVLRGLHYQIKHPQGKLVWAIVGEVFDVAVDLRKTSPTFGKWIGVTLSAETKEQLWLPPGFAHGFYTLSEWAEILYKATDFYAPEWERTLLWNDPQIGIEWPLIGGNQPVLSEKDAQGTLLVSAELYD